MRARPTIGGGRQLACSTRRAVSHAQLVAAGRKHKTWRKRWFVQTGGTLRYYEGVPCVSLRAPALCAGLGGLQVRLSCS